MSRIARELHFVLKKAKTQLRANPASPKGYAGQEDATI